MAFTSDSTTGFHREVWLLAKSNRFRFNSADFRQLEVNKSEPALKYTE